jgi:uncharacterized Zn-finger protein
MDKSFFWTVFKADFIFSLCSIGVTILLTVGISIWRKRKNKKLAAQGGSAPLQGPRVFYVGGKEPNPGHCPLCGRDWPLPGPDTETIPSPARTEPPKP